MQEKKNYFWNILPWLPAVIAICYLWGYIVMVILAATNYITEIAVACIGGAAVVIAALIAGIIALVGQWKQLKRDGKTIDKICGQASDMKPQVEEIQSTVKAIEPSIIRIEDRSSKIDAIASTVQSFNQMKEATAKESPDKVIAAIVSVYDQLIKTTEENNALLKENQELKNELEKQKALNRKLTKSYHDLQR